MEHDQPSSMPGRSREIDANALQAQAESNAAPLRNTVNTSDPANTQQCPLGNPEDPNYSRGRKVGGGGNPGMSGY